MTESLAGELRAVLDGRVLVPGDDGWDAARHAWNLSVDQRPAVVVEAATAADVAATVRVAARCGVAVATQPRGHGATGALDGTVLLRPTGLRELHVDPETRTARIGAGVRWQRLNEALDGSGLSSLPGSSSDPSVVGYTIGGGLSWFGRRFGLAAHRIRAVDLVTADGTPVRVTGDTDPDLFWALRGGGGDFGVVTALELELLPVDSVHGGRLMWPVGRAAAVLTAYRELTASAPDELTAWACLLHLPDAPTVPADLRGAWVVTVDVTYLGTAADAERTLRPLLGGALPPPVGGALPPPVGGALPPPVGGALPPPIGGALGPVRLADLGALAGEPTEPTPLLDAAMLLDDLSGEAVATLLDTVAPVSASALAVVTLRHLGGALARPAADHGCAGHIPEPYLLVMGGPAPDPPAAAALAADIDRVAAAMKAFGSGRTPPNFGHDATRTYPPDVLARLRSIKRHRDPHGVIRSNRPV